jgi:hypothetical protein
MKQSQRVITTPISSSTLNRWIGAAVVARVCYVCQLHSTGGEISVPDTGYTYDELRQGLPKGCLRRDLKCYRYHTVEGFSTHTLNLGEGNTKIFT